jgi:hypothetical protein
MIHFVKHPVIYSSDIATEREPFLLDSFQWLERDPMAATDSSLLLLVAFRGNAGLIYGRRPKLNQIERDI